MRTVSAEIYGCPEEFLVGALSALLCYENSPKHFSSIALWPSRLIDVVYERSRCGVYCAARKKKNEDKGAAERSGGFPAIQQVPSLTR